MDSGVVGIALLAELIGFGSQNGPATWGWSGVSGFSGPKRTQVDQVGAVVASKLAEVGDWATREPPARPLCGGSVVGGAQSACRRSVPCLVFCRFRGAGSLRLSAFDSSGTVGTSKRGPTVRTKSTGVEIKVESSRFATS